VIGNVSLSFTFRTMPVSVAFLNPFDSTAMVYLPIGSSAAEKFTYGSVTSERSVRALSRFWIDT
jgi:hypothetical protein